MWYHLELLHVATQWRTTVMHHSQTRAHASECELSHEDDGAVYLVVQTLLLHGACVLSLTPAVAAASLVVRCGDVAQCPG